jgi:hypothetical protein
MRKKTILALLAFIFFWFFPGHYVFAEDGTYGKSTSETQEGRYGKSWTCSDIVSESAKWALTDLPKDIKQEGYTYR